MFSGVSKVLACNSEEFREKILGNAITLDVTESRPFDDFSGIGITGSKNF